MLQRNYGHHIDNISFAEYLIRIRESKRADCNRTPTTRTTTEDSSLQHKTPHYSSIQQEQSQHEQSPKQYYFEFPPELFHGTMTSTSSTNLSYGTASGCSVSSIESPITIDFSIDCDNDEVDTRMEVVDGAQMLVELMH